MKILIISGGNTSEREISLISGRAVEKSLVENGHQVEFFDLKESLNNLDKIIKNFDLIFPVIHGEEGEGGKLQKFLSKKGKPFVGGDWAGFKKGWYKIPFKKFCEIRKIKTAQWEAVKNGQDIVNFGFPSVLKSSSGGSSKEVLILRSKKDLKSKNCQQLLKSNQEFFIEKFIEGLEVTVAV
ncbi:MAG: D-alanine-D-alanine ligase, partial [Microgenomates group bacterium Gr01-1014_93]